MSREHRRSLVAFALVALACVVVMASGLRSSALQGVLGHPARRAAAVVSGSVLDRAAQPRTTTAVTPDDVRTDAPEPSALPAGHPTAAPPAGHQAAAPIAGHATAAPPAGHVAAAPPAGHSAYASEPWHPDDLHAAGHGHARGHDAHARGNHRREHAHGLARGHEHAPGQTHALTRHFWPQKHR